MKITEHFIYSQNRLFSNVKDFDKFISPFTFFLKEKKKIINPIFKERSLLERTQLYIKDFISVFFDFMYAHVSSGTHGGQKRLWVL